MFNQKHYATFPEEGHTIKYEIRLYSSIDAAQKSIIPFKILTHNEISTLLAEKDAENLNNRIRIVDNEGSQVVKIIKGLSIIDNIIFNYKYEEQKCKEHINNYNQTNNIELKLSNSTIDLATTYNEPLSYQNIVNQLPYHIAKQLYFVFDFKPLEEQVFVPKTSGENLPHVQVFTSAKGLRTGEYCLKEGRSYRLDQKNSALGYNEEVIFRKEEIDLELLAEKIVDHLNIAITAFRSFKNSLTPEQFLSVKILEMFGELIATDYVIDRLTFINIIKKHDYWPCLPLQEQEDDFSSDSEIEITNLHTVPQEQGEEIMNVVIGNTNFIPQKG